MKKWDAEIFTINARLKILTRLMLNRVNRRVNAINPAALVIFRLPSHLWSRVFELQQIVYNSKQKYF